MSGNKFSITNGASYLLGGFGPDERLRVLVPGFDEPRESPVLQLGDAVETAAPDGLLTNQAKPPSPPD